MECYSFLRPLPLPPLSPVCRIRNRFEIDVIVLAGKPSTSTRRANHELPPCHVLRFEIPPPLAPLLSFRIRFPGTEIQLHTSLITISDGMERMDGSIISSRAFFPHTETHTQLEALLNGTLTFIAIFLFPLITLLTFTAREIECKSRSLRRRTWCFFSTLVYPRLFKRSISIEIYKVSTW